MCHLKTWLPKPNVLSEGHKINLQERLDLSPVDFQSNTEPLHLSILSLLKTCRGWAIVNGGLSNDGAMAAIGMSWEEASKACPPGVYPACHNGATNVTVSGIKPNVHVLVVSKPLRQRQLHKISPCKSFFVK